MSVLGKRKRPNDIKAHSKSPKKIKENEPTNEYISSDNEDDDLKSGEINILKTSNGPQSTDSKDYYSTHKGYNAKQPWKLFFSEDYGQYKYGLEDKKCELGKSVFKKSGDDGKKGHFISSKKHQIQLLQFLIKKNVSLPIHKKKKNK